MKTYYLLKRTALPFIFFALIACGTNTSGPVEVPANILSEEKFTRLLVDFALAESASNMNIINVSIHKLDSAYAFAPLVENNIRRSQYDSAVTFYTEHADFYKRIYENVMETLTEMEAKRDTVKKDSGRALKPGLPR